MKDMKWLQLMAAVFLFVPLTSAQDQGQKPAEQKQPAKKAKRVWSDENIDSVRKPSDVYQDQNAPKANATQGQGAVTANGTADPGTSAATTTPAELPNDIEGMEKVVADKKADAIFADENLVSIKDRIESETSLAEKARWQKKLTLAQAAAKTAHEGQKAMEDRLAEMKAKAPKTPGLF